MIANGFDLQQENLLLEFEIFLAYCDSYLH